MKAIPSNTLTRIFREKGASSSYTRKYGLYLSTLLKKIDYSSVENVIQCFLDARERSSAIFFVGNGGSAATAAHFAQDLAEVGRKTGTTGFKALALTSNVAQITALANDYSYDDIFTGQMKDVFQKNDLLVAISASGNSANIVKAVTCARELGGITIGLVGFNGGKISSLCDYTLHVKTPAGEYGPVEDMHLVFDHMITSYLHMRLKVLG